MQELSIALGITAALLHGTAFMVYNVQAKLKTSSPNAASWSIWAFLAIINAISYREMSGDWVATLQFFTGSVMCTFTFLYVLVLGRFSRLKTKEWVLFVIGVLASVVLWKFRSATGANMIALGAVLISFYPTFEGVLRDPFKETPLSWNLWTLAFLASVTNLVIRDAKLIAFITPVLMLFLHWSVALLSTQKRKLQFQNKSLLA